MSLDALATQMNITDAEVEAWAQKKYPQFLANKSLVKRLYLIEKGVRFSAPFQPKELRSINQLVGGETADIQAVVVQELSTRSYIGCPNGSKKIPDAIEGKEAVCPKCGQIVKPKSLQWALFLVGDARVSHIRRLSHRCSGSFALEQTCVCFLASDRKADHWSEACTGCHSQQS